MKNFFVKGTLLLFMIGVFLLQNVQASNTNASAATFDENEIYNSFTEVNDVISYIESNENTSYSDLTAANIPTESLSNTAALASGLQDGTGQPPLLSAFWWGCITGPIGIVVVAVTTENDRDQIKKAVFGCAIPVGCSALSYIVYAIYVAAVLNSVGY